jgi:hypothetical protein
MSQGDNTFAPTRRRKAEPMDHSGHSAGQSLTSTIFRSLDSMFSLSHYVFTSYTTTLKTGHSIVGGICELFTWSMCVVNVGFIVPSPVFSSNGVTTPGSTQRNPHCRKHCVVSGCCQAMHLVSMRSYIDTFHSY